MNHHIAVDIGASSGRVVLGTMTKGKIELTEIYRFANGIVEQNGSYFWNMEKLLEEIITGLRLVKKAGITECTLGIDTWAVDYALVAADGNLVGKIYAYRDHRTDGVIQDFQQELSLAEVYQKTGIQFLNFNTLFQLYVHAPAELAKAQKILLVPDYLYYRLSGKFISEKTNASTTQLLNLQTKDYDVDLLNIIKVRRNQFADLTEPGELVGPILEPLREQYDLPRCELICVATHDTASAILGVPAVDEYFAYLSSGTWSLMGVENTTPIVNELSRANNYSNEWGAYGTYRFLKNIMGLWLIQEIQRCLGQQSSFADLAAQAAAVTPFRFLIDCNDQRFFKPAHMIREIQQYCRETGQPVPKTEGELARCVFDSLALMYRKTLAEIAVITGRLVQSLHIVGGGVQNRLLCQLTADVANINVFAGPVESTALGNILVQMISTGELANIQAARELAMSSFDIKLYQPGPVANLEEVWEKFSRLVVSR